MCVLDWPPQRDLVFETAISGERSDAHSKPESNQQKVRLDFLGAAITSDAGLLASCELGAALGLTETANENFHMVSPPRLGYPRNIRRPGLGHGAACHIDKAGQVAADAASPGVAEYSEGLPRVAAHYLAKSILGLKSSSTRVYLREWSKGKQAESIDI